LAREENRDLRDLLRPVQAAQNSQLAAYRLANLVAQQPEIEPRVRELLPPKMEIHTFREFAEDYIYSAIRLLDGAIVVGGLLTVGVLLLFLRSVRPTAVVALAIPISVIGTFLMLHLLGRSLNVISLAGLAFAVGMVVDNAVVVLENIYRHHQAGEDPFRAAVLGTAEVWGAVLASTLPTLAVFVPVLFVQEEAGQLFRDIALAISSAVGLSLLVSITAIPPAAARILQSARSRSSADERLAASPLPAGPANDDISAPAGQPALLLRAVDAVAERFVGGVMAVNACLQRSVPLRVATVCLFTGASLVLSFLMMPKVEYLPMGNRNQIIGQVAPPPGYNLDRMLELGEKLEDDARPYWDVDRGARGSEHLAYPPVDDYTVLIDLTIAAGEASAGRLEDLPGLPVHTLSGKLTRLEGLPDASFAGSAEAIFRRERQRALAISVAPPDEMPLEQAMDLIENGIVEPLRQNGQIGEAYEIRLSGTADKLAATWQALRWNLVLAALITYLLMAGLFESWLYPLVIMFSVPFGAVGGFLGLAALNGYLGLWPHGGVQSLDVVTMLGFVILIRTVVNNAILIVHQSLNHMRRDEISPDDAILMSVRTRMRPIFMTTLTTVLGLLPLVLFPGEGSELYRGLGAVVLGGLLVSTLFTLVLVPTVFRLVLEARTALLRP